MESNSVNYEEYLLHYAQPLGDEDFELHEKAVAFIKKHYHRDFHHLGSAVRAVGRIKKIYYGLQLDCKLGNDSVCAEPVAIANTETGGDRVHTICTVHHSHEPMSRIQAVVPCPACRGRLIQFSPNSLVIIPFGDKLVKVPARALYPVPYRPRVRQDKPSEIEEIKFESNVRYEPPAPE